jgi:hypothetical protein
MRGKSQQKCCSEGIKLPRWRYKFEKHFACGLTFQMMIIFGGAHFLYIHFYNKVDKIRVLATLNTNVLKYDHRSHQECIIGEQEEKKLVWK